MPAPILTPIIVIANIVIHGPTVGNAIVDKDAAPDELKHKIAKNLVLNHIQAQEDKTKQEMRQYQSRQATYKLNLERCELLENCSDRLVNFYQEQLESTPLFSPDIMEGMKLKSSELKGNFSKSFGHSVFNIQGILNSIKGDEYVDYNEFVALFEKDIDGKTHEYKLTCEMKSVFSRDDIDQRTLGDKEPTFTTAVELDKCILENVQSGNEVYASLSDNDYVSINESERYELEKEILEAQNVQKAQSSVTQE